MKKIKAKSEQENGLLLELRAKERIHIREEIFLLACFMEEWYWQNREMKNRREYRDPEYLLKRWESIRHKILGGPGYGNGYLQDKINMSMENILVRFKEDLPFLRDTDYFAYSYFLAGFDNRMVAYLLGLESAKIASAVKGKLKYEFMISHSPHKFEYMAVLPHLPARQLPIWQRNAIFA